MVVAWTSAHRNLLLYKLINQQLWYLAKVTIKDSMLNKIEIRCKNGHCNRLFMNYYVTGNNVDLNLEGFELKCEKCKRVLRLKHYTEQMLIERSENGVFKV